MKYGSKNFTSKVFHLIVSFGEEQYSVGIYAVSWK
jgi:hypothetical protein